MIRVKALDTTRAAGVGPLYAGQVLDLPDELAAHLSGLGIVEPSAAPLTDPAHARPAPPPDAWFTVTPGGYASPFRVVPDPGATFRAGVMRAAAVAPVATIRDGSARLEAGVMRAAATMPAARMREIYPLHRDLVFRDLFVPPAPDEWREIVASLTGEQHAPTLDDLS